MSDSLTTYLHDHMAGANFAIEVLGFLRKDHADDPVGGAVTALLAEIEEDREVLKGIIDRAGGGTPVLKGAAAWLGEKVSEFKLRRGAFGTFEALETLALGILGKRAMWRALEVAAATDTRVRGIDFGQLVTRAEKQYARAEDLRLVAAQAAFAPADE